MGYVNHSVTVNVAEGNVVTVKGPKGELTKALRPEMILKQEGSTITVERPSDDKLHRSLHGLTRTLLSNMVTGVTEGFKKELDVNGVGYRVAMEGSKLVMNLGFSHQVIVSEIEGITIDVPAPNKIVINGCDKQMVGQFAGVPTGIVGLALVGSLVTSCTVVMFGEAIWDPVQLTGMIDNVPLVIGMMAFLIIATLTTNIAANALTPATAIVHLTGGKINFKWAAIVLGIVGVLIRPWVLVNDMGVYMNFFLNGGGALLGPIIGITICHYFFVCHTELNLRSLYVADDESKYTNLKKFNVPTYVLCFATTVVLLGALITRFTSVNLDGFLGLAVAVFIVVSGVKLIMETGNPLLGTAPDAALVRTIYEKILSYPGIFGIHDLTVHNYGEGKCFASVHCEVPAEEDILVSHDIIDNIERDFQRDMGIQLVIHLDPVVTGDERTNKLREQVGSLLHVVYPQAAMHDFRVVWGVTHSNVVFDVAVPFSLADSDDQVKERIAQAVSTLDPTYRAVVTVDRESTVNELES